ncbi:hypothetical protein MNBD_CHLOROFLEXI01-4322 [hydrothermal vent metagenome]|uniref:Peptidase C39-like domain-containing protein n=1 Tax=hydrothermal vent metagenome TaxID=652676 RepID=A0A3B0WAI1_9ZZZZ
MTLQAIGTNMSYQNLLSILDIHSWGTPHRNILKLSNLFSTIHVTYKQGEIIDLIRFLDANLSPIAFVWTGELPYWSIPTWHAIVLVGHDDDNFYVNDPAFSATAQPVSIDDFDLAWLAYDSYFAVIEKT